MCSIVQWSSPLFQAILKDRAVHRDMYPVDTSFGEYLQHVKLKKKSPQNNWEIQEENSP